MSVKEEEDFIVITLDWTVKIRGWMEGHAEAPELTKLTCLLGRGDL